MINLDVSHLDRSLKGGVVLASSGPGEAAQESEDLGGSFFTHYLVSGLRGGADRSGDGQVSLDEAYQFVYQHTLDRTRTSMLGPQHPSYGMNVGGRGELVLTWRREGQSALLWPVDAPPGTYFVRDGARGRVVAEVDKEASTEVRLALKAGRYEVSRADHKQLWTTDIQLREGQEQRLDPAAMRPSPLSARTSKGTSTQFAVGAAYALSSGYLLDAGLLHGADLRVSWRPGAWELGASLGFAYSSYLRRDAIEIGLSQWSAGAFAELGTLLFGELWGSVGAELRLAFAHQKGSSQVVDNSVEGTVVPILATAGLAHPLGALELWGRGTIGPTLFDGPAGLSATLTGGVRLGVSYAF